jgi:predicted transcriptional regulator
MPKTVTLRLSDETYQKFLSAARAEKRPLSNLIEVLALKKLEEDLFVDAIEMEEILSNEELMTRLERGAREAQEKKGRFVE